MKIARWAVIGFATQALSLLAFIYVSKLSVDPLAKSIVVAAAAIAMGWLLWGAAKTALRFELIGICAVLAAGYIAAFHTIGLLWSPGLLKDWDGFSSGYAISVLAVLGVLFVVYAVIALVLSWLQTLWKKRGKES